MSGFDIAVLTHENEAKPIQGKASRFHETVLNARLFLVSKDIDTPVKEDVTKSARNKRTHNRKRVTYDDIVTVNGKDYRVNSEKSGLYVDIIKRIIEQFQIAVRKWGRVFVLRFDLHQPCWREDSKHITNFRKRLFQKLKREYGFDDIGFCWAREQKSSEAQHYHWVLLLDGDMVRHSSRIIKIIKEAWELLNGSYEEAWELPDTRYHVPVIKRPFYFANDERVIQDAVYRTSYLAKARDKGYRPPQAKDYGCSRMTYN